jgi:hypothetical protein
MLAIAIGFTDVFLTVFFWADNVVANRNNNKRRLYFFIVK